MTVPMPMAHVNDIDLYYETHGSGFPLLYSHGGFGGLGTGAVSPLPSWLDEFARHFQVILYDRRSSGRSSFPRTPHTMKLFASDALALLRHLGIERAHHWGTSAGGPIVMEFGLRFPEATQALVVHETSPRFWDEGLEADRATVAALRERIRILETDGDVAAYEARRTSGTVGIQVYAASRPAVNEGDAEERETRRQALTAQLAAIPRDERVRKYAGELLTYSAYAGWDARERFGALKMPVLIPYSPDETVLPNAGWDELAVSMPNATYLPVPGVDHGQTLTVPGVQERILEFLLQHTP